MQHIHNGLLHKNQDNLLQTTAEYKIKKKLALYKILKRFSDFAVERTQLEPCIFTFMIFCRHHFVNSTQVANQRIIFFF